jgi:acid phosphatase type 7
MSWFRSSPATVSPGAPSATRLALGLGSALCLLSLPATAAEIVRGPFLQQTGPQSALVVVETDTSASVEASANGKTTQSQGTRHVLSLSGLPPASAVDYQVLVDGAAAASGTFRTPGVPKTQAARHAIIGVIGDMGSGGANERANVLQMKARGVEAVLTVGDNAYPNGAPEDWDPKLFEPFAPLLPFCTLWPALGDHEYITPYASGYLEAFELPDGPHGERYYSFDWGDLHVVVLDTNCVDPLDAATSGCSGPAMVEWLRADLLASTAPWKIVTMHRAAVATGKYGFSKKVATALIPVFEELGVDLVFQGHNHFYERSWPALAGQPVQESYDNSGAPVYVTSGGGGDWVYEPSFPPAVWTAFRATEYQHVVMTQDGGSLRIEAVRPDGTVLDQFELQKDVPPPATELEPASITLGVRRATSKPSIDAELSEFAAADAIQVEAGGAPATFRLMWDDEFLYLAATVDDPALFVRATGTDAELWDSDSIELLLDPDRSKSAQPEPSDRHLIVSVLGDVLDAHGAGPGEDRSASFGAVLAAQYDGTLNDAASDAGSKWPCPSARSASPPLPACASARIWH